MTRTCHEDNTHINIGKAAKDELHKTLVARFDKAIASLGVYRGRNAAIVALIEEFCEQVEKKESV